MTKITVPPQEIEREQLAPGAVLVVDAHVFYAGEIWAKPAGLRAESTYKLEARGEALM